jgi:hypothetical protein
MEGVRRKVAEGRAKEEAERRARSHGSGPSAEVIRCNAATAMT